MWRANLTALSTAISSSLGIVLAGETGLMFDFCHYKIRMKRAVEVLNSYVCYTCKTHFRRISKDVHLY
jgi:hypothetical protein